MIVRLRARNAFLEMLGEVRKVDAIVLCEGAREALAVEKVGTRLGAVGEKKNVAIVDSEGLGRDPRRGLPAQGPSMGSTLPSAATALTARNGLPAPTL